MKGLYALLLSAAGRIAVGKLGNFPFEGGDLYLYIGSARGPGGFKRVERHLAIAAGERQTRRWHVDYLLAAGQLHAVWLIPDPDPDLDPDPKADAKAGTVLGECALVRELIAHGASPAIPGFGASDSECETHLLRVGSYEAAEALLQEVARELGLGLEFRPLRLDRTPP